LEQLLHPTLDPTAERTVVAKGLPASPGAAVGRVVFSADEAELRVKAGDKVILVRIETSPEDIHGMHVAEGILTARGGMTSHAAVVARGMGKCCVSGCGALRIDYAADAMEVDGHAVSAGDFITIDGSSGEVMLGEIPTVTPKLGGGFEELMRWADKIRTVKVRTNADTPNDARIARQFGAEGIGLCRTEHMFFEPNRILAVREMILAADIAERERALAKLLPMQRGDFVGLFEAMGGQPVTIRLLDPPLHEFLPHTEEEIREVASALGSGIQPDAGSSGLSPRHQLPRDLPDAGPGDRRGGLPGRRVRGAGTAGDHDSAGLPRRRARAPSHPGGGGEPEGTPRTPQGTGTADHRNHDRGAQGSPHRWEDRRVRRLLLFRDQ
jgi:pyruvate,orthophosphate dikinase